MGYQYKVLIKRYMSAFDRIEDETHTAKNTEDLQYIMYQFVYYDSSVRLVTITPIKEKQ